MPLIGVVNIQWPYIIYFTLFAFILPIYLVLIFVLVKLRRSNAAFKTTFYAILVQNSIADILALSVYGVEKILTIIFPVSFQGYEGFLLPAKLYYTVFWFIMIRSHGVVFLSIHRYLTIVQPHHFFAKHIQTCSTSLICALFWIPPIIVSLILFSDFHIKFVYNNGLLQVVPETADITEKNTRRCMVLLIIFCLIAVVCYVFIGKLIRQKSDSISRSMRRELKLALQVFILVAAQIIILLFFASLNILAGYGMNDELLFVKTFTPYIYGLSSFCSPFTLLFFNKELAKRVKKLFVIDHNVTQVDSSMKSNGSVIFKTSNNSNSLADILALTFYSLEKVVAVLFPEFLNNLNKRFPAAPVIYYTVFWFITFRCNGLILLTIHRYLMIVKPFSSLTQYVKNLNFLKILSIYWIPSLILNVLFLSDPRIEFESPQTLLAVGETPEISYKISLTAIIMLFVSISICAFFYLLIGMFIKKNAKTVTKSAKKEVKLALQVFLLLTTQLILFLFMTMLNLTRRNNEVNVQIKKFTPLAFGLPSFVSPFVVLLFKNEWSERVKIMLRLKKAPMKSQEQLTVTVSHNQNNALFTRYH